MDLESNVLELLFLIVFLLPNPGVLQGSVVPGDGQTLSSRSSSARSGFDPFARGLLGKRSNSRRLPPAGWLAFTSLALK